MALRLCCFSAQNSVTSIITQSKIKGYFNNVSASTQSCTRLIFAPFATSFPLGQYASTIIHVLPLSFCIFQSFCLECPSPDSYNYSLTSFRYLVIMFLLVRASWSFITERPLLIYFLFFLPCFILSSLHISPPNVSHYLCICLIKTKTSFNGVSQLLYLNNVYRLNKYFVETVNESKRNIKYTVEYVYLAIQ